ncbi:MAG TPA: hypothetical protein DCY72_02095 [Ruminococcaceae bacterium]|nr:hypothetical protein [Oscillospiraceae bacterium]
MFQSVRLKNIRLTILSLIGVLLFVTICLVALRGRAADTMEHGGERISLNAEDEADVERFLTSCGYSSIEFLFQTEVTVPKNWNDIYTEYNELQRQQGFDLVPYKGETVEEYVYFVNDTLNATVLVSEQKIIAAHVADCDGREMRMIN